MTSGFPLVGEQLLGLANNELIFGMKERSEQEEDATVSSLSHSQRC